LNENVGKFINFADIEVEIYEFVEMGNMQYASLAWGMDLEGLNLHTRAFTATKSQC